MSPSNEIGREKPGNIEISLVFFEWGNSMKFMKEGDFFTLTSFRPFGQTWLAQE